MKNIYKCFLILSMCFTTLSATSQSISDLFLSVPEDMMFGLSEEAKQYLVASTNDTVAILSALDTPVRRLDMTDEFLSIQTSPAGNLQFKVLPLVNDSKIICVVNTVCKKMCDSHVRFFTTDWQDVDSSSLLPTPSLDWFLKTDVDRQSQDFQNAIAVVDMLPLKYELNKDNLQLIISNELKAYLSENNYKKIEPYLTDEKKVLTWNRSSFN